MYIDGKLDSTQTVALGSSGSDTVVIGKDNSTNYANGRFDDVLIYNQALNAAHISRLASRRGIAYELTPVRRASVVASFNRRRRLLAGAGS
jgi:hypothetical protein